MIDLFLILAVGLIILAFFRILELITKKMQLSRIMRSHTGKFLVAAEISAWLVYVVWALFYWLSAKSYFPYLIYSLVVVLVLLFSWFILKDIIAGIVFRFQGSHDPGSQFSVKEISGRIRKIGLTHLYILDDAGAVVRIPYSRLSSRIISETRGTEDAHTRISFTIGIPSDGDNIPEQIRHILLNCPWISPRSEPVIRIVRKNEGQYEIDVLANLAGKDRLTYVEKYLKRKIAEISTKEN